MIRIRKNINYDEFLEAVEKCEGDVSLKSPDVYLNLKSSLCKYFAINQVFNNPDVDFYKDIQIVFDKPEDVLKLKDYLEEV